MAIFFVMGSTVIITSLILTLLLFRLILDMKKRIRELERRMQHMASEIKITISETSSIRNSICDLVTSRKLIEQRETKASVQSIVRKKKGKEVRSSLPMEILEEILSRLPSNCLPKFRSVCMQWNTLLSYNHHFMVEHHRKALLFRPMLISSCSDFGTIPLFSIVRESMKDCSIKNTTSSGCYNISNPVNGLVCLYDTYTSYIMNPSTLEIASFPEITYHRFSSSSSIGLGYDGDARVYKVVSVTVKGDMTGCLCEMLTLGDKNWRFLEELSVVVLHKSPCCFFNGKLHWLTASNKQSLSLGILSCDVKQEKYETYPIFVVVDSDTKCSELALKEFQRHFYLVKGSRTIVQIWELIKCNNSNILSFKGDQVFYINMSMYIPHPVSRFRVAYADVLDNNFLFLSGSCMYHLLSGKLCKVHPLPYKSGKQGFHFFAESLMFPRKLLTGGCFVDTTLKQIHVFYESSVSA